MVVPRSMKVFVLVLVVLGFFFEDEAAAVFIEFRKWEDC